MPSSFGMRDQLLDQGDDVVLGQDAGVEVDVEVEAGVQLVAADPGQVVALGVEEQLLEQRPGGVDRRRLARPLLLEQLDQRALLGLGRLGVGLDRVADVDRVVEQLEDLLVGDEAHRAQQHGDRQLALAVDAGVDAALLVDLELEPGAAGRHQVGDEDLLLAVLRLHHVGAGRAHELGDDDALGAVDDEGAAVRHPREVAHEDGLLADLAGLAVLERDRDVQRARVGDVLLAALGDRVGRLVELEVAEDDREIARVVLDRRDVVDRLPQQSLLRVGQRLEGEALDIDQMWDFKRVLEAGKGPPGDRGSVGSGQLGDSSDGRGTRIRARDSGSKGSTARDPAKYHSHARLGKPSRPVLADRAGAEPTRLLELDLAAGLLELGLELLGLLALDALLDGLRRLVDERLGLLEARGRWRRGPP